MSIRRSLFLFILISLLFLTFLYLYLMPEVDVRRLTSLPRASKLIGEELLLRDNFLYKVSSDVKEANIGSGDERKSNMINDDAKDDVRFEPLRSSNGEEVHFSLKENEDEDQDPVKLGMVNNANELKLKKEGYKKYAFNVLVSNRLSLKRTIPDTRHTLCKNATYPPISVLPSVSVVICFYNEALSVLLRTVYSVLTRSEPSLLHEILLIDDYSENHETEQLDAYIEKNLPKKVKLMRTPERAGLIRARNFGAHHATGAVLVFLDSHCEVNTNWLVPLVARIHEYRTHVVCPIIDIIHSDTFEYSSSPLVKGGFNWGLHFQWDSVPESMLTKKTDFVRPISSPTMAGGLYAIDRKYFFELGKYDDGMDIWGGENLEMSFRVWMCGGKLEILPCSRVGHIFRDTRPYGSPTGEDTMSKNSLRLANVWMDEYKQYFLESRTDLVGKPYGDISGRQKLREQLGCRSFDWYVKNVYTDLKPPLKRSDRIKIKERLAKIKRLKPHYYRRKLPHVINKFQIQLPQNFCLEPKGGKPAKGSLVVLAKCASGKKQRWSETDKHELRLFDSLCLDSDKGNVFAVLSKCHEQGGKQDWRHSGRRTLIQNLGAGMCLGVRKARVDEPVVMSLCHKRNAQQWTLISAMV